jgi:hypothetical protein
MKQMVIILKKFMTIIEINMSLQMKIHVIMTYCINFLNFFLPWVVEGLTPTYS